MSLNTEMNEIASAITKQNKLLSRLLTTFENVQTQNEKSLQKSDRIIVLLEKLSSTVDTNSYFNRRTGYNEQRQVFNVQT